MTRRALVPFAAGLIFALGLAVAGMTDPSKIIAFLDFTGRWDPTLAFVMVGAISVHFSAHRLARRRSRTLSGESFELPTQERIDGRLLLGSAIFGLGWGIAGYCPGPLLVSIAGGARPAIVACLGMLGGIGLHELTLVSRATRTSPPACGGADLV